LSLYKLIYIVHIQLAPLNLLDFVKQEAEKAWPYGFSLAGHLRRAGSVLPGHLPLVMMTEAPR
jgi:hypothetical protein